MGCNICEGHMANSKFRGKPGSATASTASWSPRADTFVAPRMLAPSEIELLKRDAQQTVETVWRNIERRKAA